MAYFTMDNSNEYYSQSMPLNLRTKIQQFEMFTNDDAKKLCDASDMFAFLRK